MVSYAKPPKVPQIAFQVQGELQMSFPLHLKNFSMILSRQRSRFILLATRNYTCGMPFSRLSLFWKTDTWTKMLVSS